MSNSLWPHGLHQARLLCPWDFPGKNTGVGCQFFLQGIFPTQGSNLHHLNWQADSLPLSHQGSPMLYFLSCFIHSLLLKSIFNITSSLSLTFCLNDSRDNMFLHGILFNLVTFFFPLSLWFFFSKYLTCLCASFQLDWKKNWTELNHFSQLLQPPPWSLLTFSQFLSNFNAYTHETQLKNCEEENSGYIPIWIEVNCI